MSTKEIIGSLLMSLVLLYSLYLLATPPYLLPNDPLPARASNSTGVSNWVKQK